MYHYIENKDFLKRMKSYCSDLVNQLVQKINREDTLTVTAYLVGSGAKNLITQNEKEPIDCDYNIQIIDSNVFSINNGQQIKEYIRKKFNEVLKENGLSDCHDSTSVLTSGYIVFNKGNKTEFSIDLAIVKETSYGWQRLVHRKTGFVANDQWYWNDAPNSKGLLDRVEAIKRNNLWLEVRDVYLTKKNFYLKQQDTEHPSFKAYIETINEVYYRNIQCRR